VKRVLPGTPEHARTTEQLRRVVALAAERELAPASVDELLAAEAALLEPIQPRQPSLPL
jgi:hypothetical protein